MLDHRDQLSYYNEIQSGHTPRSPLAPETLTSKNRLVPIELKIAKFRSAKRINALEAFPLQYHVQATEIRADFFRCGRKYMSLMGANHCYCNGSAFYMCDGELLEVRIDSRIMVVLPGFGR